MLSDSEERVKIMLQTEFYIFRPFDEIRKTYHKDELL